MRVEFNPSELSGEIPVPPSKSVTHRLLICAAMARGTSHIAPVELSEDVKATADCLGAFGIRTEMSEGGVTVFGKAPSEWIPCAAANCRESASTLRFLIPVVSLCGREAHFTGSERLMNRPLQEYDLLFAKQGLHFEKNGRLVRMKGRLKTDELTVGGNMSSQFATGLLMAMAGAEKGGRLTLSGEIESRPYIDLTVQILNRFGVKAVAENERTLIVPSHGGLQPGTYAVEGDCSNAAYLEALRRIGHSVRLTGVPERTRQGDGIYSALFDLLQSGTPTVSVKDCPDLAPVLLALGAQFHGVTLTDTRRLSLKESDRADAAVRELQKFGALITAFENHIEVRPSTLHTPPLPIDSHGDHRIAMAMSVLLTKYGGVLTGAESVNKSFPSFFDRLIRCGAKLTVSENRTDKDPAHD